MDFTIGKSTALKPFDKHWQFCVGSGHAGLAMRTDYVKQLKVVHDELGINRVRFHGIFCDDMHTLHSLRDIIPLPGGQRFTEQSFRLCGLVFDNLLECGMQPFVELGFMPKMLAKKQRKGMFFYKPIVSMPKSDAAWTLYIQDFVRFLIRRYGAQEVRSWFFEVWNEPDLRIAFFAGTQADYFHLYEITARAIKAVDPEIPVGGPSTSGSKWVEAFVAFCRAGNVPLDFVTTHQYAGDPLGGVRDQGGPVKEKKEKGEAVSFSLGKLLNPFKGMPDGSVLQGVRAFMGDPSETRDIQSDVFVRSAPIVQQQAGGLPVYYTEWNESATFSAYTNDTRKVAAYDVRTALGLEGSLDGSSIWCFSDIFEELHPFPEEFHGGFGLMTQHGIPKPVFYALKMLEMAGGNRYVLPGALDGEISMAAFSGEGEKQVLLMRQKMKNLDLPKQTANVSLELDTEPKAVTLYRIDEEHCNPLRIWEEMGSPLDMTPAEVEQLKRDTAMVAEKMDYKYSEKMLHFSAELGVNDLYFVRVEL